MKNIVRDEESESKEEEEKSKKEGANTLSSLMEKYKQLERDKIDHEKSSFAGQLGHILTPLTKE